MESPAKRRKKNTDASRPAKGLDFFFARQTAKAQALSQNPSQVYNGGKNEVNSTTQEDSGGLPDDGEAGANTGQNGTGHGTLADEELARKLQAEWNEELQDARDGEQVAGASKASDEKLVDAPQEQMPPPVDKDQEKAPKVLTLQSSLAASDTAIPTIPLSEPLFTFDPTRYTSLLSSSSTGTATLPYSLLAHAFQLINATASRILIVTTLTNMIRLILHTSPECLLPSVWLATNSLCPPHQSLDLSLTSTTLTTAICSTCGLSPATVRTLYKQHGDAGDVAAEAKRRQKYTLKPPAALTIQGVYSSLVKIARAKGTGSQGVKLRLVEGLVGSARGVEESRYLVRTLVQHLRIGAVRSTMLIALARAFAIEGPGGKGAEALRKLGKEDLQKFWASAEECVKACFARRPDYNALVAGLLEVGVADELLVLCGLDLHIPLRPMLGSITRDLAEMLVKLQGRDFACEFKYDGQRAQVHCDAKGKVSIFSRHLETMTEKYPDLVALVPEIRGDGVQSFILEGEVVAVDRVSGDLKTFQTLTNRARKDVMVGSIKVNVCLFAFDLMFLNGESLLDRSFRERRALLRSMFVEKTGHFTWVKSLDASSEESETVLDFFKQATDMHCEGIMVKVLDNLPNPKLVDEAEPPVPTTPSKSKTKTDAEPKKNRRKALLATYEPDKRLDSWLKVKKDYHSAFDTIDLIPVAGWHGSGRKSKWWSPILLACRNPVSGGLEVVTKCMSGFTDKFYMANRAKYDPDAEESSNVVARPAYIEYSGPEPAVWFEPQEVWEMAFADITLSPTYTAGLGLVSEERGMSMRFPRFLKVREDKGLEEASDSDFLAALYRKQEAKAEVEGKGKTDVKDDDGEEEE